MVGAGMLLAAAPDAPDMASPEVQLASTDSVLVPLAPLEDEICLPYGCSLIGSSLAPPAPNALAAALTDVGVTQFKLFGNGADAPADCTGDACNGEDGGLFFGSGGNGANGGRGGNAGAFSIVRHRRKGRRRPTGTSRGCRWQRRVLDSVWRRWCRR